MASMQEQLTMSDDDLRRGVWVHDPTHMGFAMTPLFQSFILPAITEALAVVGRSGGAPPVRREVRVYHGYSYDLAADPPSRPDPLRRRATLEAMRPGFQRIRQDFERIVNEQLLPAYRELDQWPLRVHDRADASTALNRLVSLYETIWTLHMQIVMPVFSAQELYQAVFLELCPGKTAADAHELLNGASNQFVETDRALSRLAESIRNRPVVRRALESDDPVAALAELPEASDFRQNLGAVLERYGWRVGAGHDFYHKTWREDPRPALAVVRRFLEAETSFEARWQEVAARQKALLKTVWERLGPADRACFQEAFDAAWAARPLDEDHHFYIDAMLPAKSRALLLRMGALLEAEGVLTAPEQIFFLYRDELGNLFAGGPSVDGRLLESRKAEYDRYCRETPPPTLGPADRVAEADEADESGDAPTLRGVAASPGTWEGPVRIIRGVDDFSRLKRGEVLVARTTTPTWSGLFATAGAVVTDSGGILSHAATVAREYRVPCVVAARQATLRLRDGDVVRVDGVQGTVTVLSAKA